MFSFECDYHEGAHQAVLLKLIESNMEQLPGYGVDHYSTEAKEKIKAACGCPEGQVFFFAGGTQTNVTVIDSILAPYEGVITAETGHINVHEAGGVEFTGHKVLSLPSHEGKIDPEELRKYMKDYHEDEAWNHMVRPGAVYISHPTELGTLYQKEELVALKEVCNEFGLPLFLDGARLGYGLASPASDLSLQDIAALCNVFYIGGTKVGALCGEAVVFPKGDAPANFFTIMKQRGNVFAKGRVVGVQFNALFEDGLYFQLGEQALAMADLMKEEFEKRGFQFYVESQTNMQFIVVDNDTAALLHNYVGFETSGKYDEEHKILRFCTSWATSQADIQRLAEILDLVVGAPVEEPVEEIVAEEPVAEEAAVEEVAAEDAVAEEEASEEPKMAVAPIPIPIPETHMPVEGIVEEPDFEAPAVEEEAEEAPADEETSDEEPVVGEELAVEEPADEVASDEEPIVSEEPANEEPVEEAPVAEESFDEEPIVAEEPVAEELVEDAPIAEESSDEEPIVAEEPADEEPVEEAPIAEESFDEEPAVDEEPVAEKPEEAPAYEPEAIEEPVVEIPEEAPVADEEPAAEEDAPAEEKVAEAEEPVAEEPEEAPAFEPEVVQEAPEEEVPAEKIVEVATAAAVAAEVANLIDQDEPAEAAEAEETPAEEPAFQPFAFEPMSPFEAAKSFEPEVTEAPAPTPTFEPAQVFAPTPASDSIFAPPAEGTKPEQPVVNQAFEAFTAPAPEVPKVETPAPEAPAKPASTFFQSSVNLQPEEEQPVKNFFQDAAIFQNGSVDIPTEEPIIKMPDFFKKA